MGEELRPGDLLVVNDTRVMKARLRAQRASGGSVEILVLEPWQPEGSTEPEPGAADWLCLLRPAKRVRLGEWLELQGPLAAAGLHEAQPAAQRPAQQREAVPDGLRRDGATRSKAQLAEATSVRQAELAVVTSSAHIDCA